MGHPHNKHQRHAMGVARARKLARIYRSAGFEMSEDSVSFHRLVHTRVPCSCVLCGNFRKWEGLTYQEMKAYLDEQDQINEMGQ